MEMLALVVARVGEIYLARGLLFAVAFAARGVDSLDPAASESTRGFRILIVPGAMILWPLLLRRWLRGSPQPAENNAHRAAALRGDS